MATLVTLTIGDETWKMQKASLVSLRIHNKELRVYCYISLGQSKDSIVDEIRSLNCIPMDIGHPELLAESNTEEYCNYETPMFNIRTSFKWIALLNTLKETKEPVIFLDSDITMCAPLPIEKFENIWTHFPIFVQDEGLSVFPKQACTGLMGFNYSDFCMRFLESAYREHSSAIASQVSVHDQIIFNKMISSNIDLYKQIYYLPQGLFPVGYLGPIYKGFNTSQHRALLRFPEKPILYHANWAVGYQDKLKLMGSIS